MAAQTSAAAAAEDSGTVRSAPAATAVTVRRAEMWRALSVSRVRAASGPQPALSQSRHVMQRHPDSEDSLRDSSWTTATMAARVRQRLRQRGGSDSGSG